MYKMNFSFDGRNKDRSYAALMRHLEECCQEQWYCEAIIRKPDSFVHEATIAGDKNEIIYAHASW